MDINKLKNNFINLYGIGDTNLFFSPSRINIIGEHIDYNGGMVMPCAILLGTYGVVRKRNDDIINFSSENFELKVKTSIEDLKYDKEHGWANYAKGVILQIIEAGYTSKGMDILVSGNIPNGAGLSSSASLEMLIGEMVNSLFNDGKIERIELVKLCQKAENEFVGVMCGIMDQFAIGMGKKNKSMYLNCDTLQYEYIDFNLKDYTLIIMNTNKRRELNESKYNERRSECEEALKIIKEYINVDNLCNLSIEEFQKYSTYIKNETIRKRAEHVIYENFRVQKSCDALKNGKIEELGVLLKESQKSLKYLYEVTGMELDTIVETANNMEYCAGARMTGAGFGGCAIALVKENKVNEFIKDVSLVYREKIGYDADFYITGIGDGTKNI